MNRIRNRLTFLFVVALLVFAGLIFRLYQVQFLDTKNLADLARDQHVRTKPITAERGAILDENGDILAISIKVFNVFGEISELGDLDRLLNDLSSILTIDEERIRRTAAEKEKRFVRIATDITKTEADLIRDLVRNQGYRGISIEEKNKRFYPYHSLAAQTIGLTNHDGHGFLGIEQFYDALLSGTDGVEYVTTDAKGKSLPYGFHKREEPINGASIALTVNDNYQYFTQERIEQAVIASGAKSGSALVLDVNDGSIYAMASFPTYDLNNPRDVSHLIGKEEWDAMSDQEQTDFYFRNVWNNPIISDIYEPGSTMKVMVSAIGLNEGLITLGSTFDCGGSRKVANYNLRCISYPYGHGSQNLTQAFVNSCNVAYMEIGRRIGKEKMYEYFRRVGIFDQTGVDLPAEAAPNYLDLALVNEVELATLSYGHTVSINMLGAASALSSAVNGGYQIHPHLLKEIRYPDGRVELPPMAERERVFTRETVDSMKVLLEALVKHQGKLIGIDGVKIGGKSGTSVKFIDGAYRDDRVISSFIGFAPLDEPKYAVLVTLDEPDISRFGLRVAVPVADQILEDIFRHNSLIAGADAAPTAPVPDVVGLTLAEAKKKIEAAGFQFATHPPEAEDEASIVLAQFPSAGSEVSQGAVVILDLEKER